MLRALPVLLFALVVAACGPGVVYEREVGFGPAGWTYADSVAFRYEIADTTRGYDLELTLKHTDAYPAQNLYARFVTVYPNGARASEPVSLELADRFGAWLGDCAGADCTLRLPLQDGARFPEPGTYGLTLHQFGRAEAEPEVRAVGLRVLAGE